MAAIYEAMASVLAEFPVVTKDRKNPSQGYSFRGIDDVYLAAHDLLAKYKIFPLPCNLQMTLHEAPDTNRGGKQYRALVHGELRFTHADGSSVSVGLAGEGIDSSDKAGMKAISNAVKYAYWNTFCVPNQVKKDSEAFHADEPDEPDDYDFQPRGRR